MDCENRRILSESNLYTKLVKKKNCIEQEPKYKQEGCEILEGSHQFSTTNDARLLKRELDLFSTFGPRSRCSSAAFAALRATCMYDSTQDQEVNRVTRSTLGWAQQGPRFSGLVAVVKLSNFLAIFIHAGPPLSKKWNVVGWLARYKRETKRNAKIGDTADVAARKEKKKHDVSNDSIENRDL